MTLCDVLEIIVIKLSSLFHKQILKINKKITHKPQYREDHRFRIYHKF